MRILLLALVSATGASAVDDYKLTPDSLPQADVPKGKLDGPFEWKSKVFPDTTRQYWVFVPAQYDKAKAAAVMVFQDGHAYGLPNEGYKAPTVFDTCRPWVSTVSGPGTTTTARSRSRARMSDTIELTP